MRLYDSAGRLKIDMTGLAGGGAGSLNISAGTTSNLLTAVTFSDSNGISFGLNASTITAQHNAITSQSNQTQSNIQGIVVSNTTYHTGDVTFSNLNGISFGSNGANVVTASYTVPTVTNSSWTVSDAVTSGTVGRLAFTNLNGVTLSLSTGAAGSHTIVGSHNAITSQSVQTQSNIQGIIISDTTYRTGDVSFSNLNGISFGSNGANVITASYTVPAAGAAITVSDAATSGTIGRLAFTNLNGITLSLSTGAGGSHTIVGSHNALTSQSNQAFSAAGGSSAFQTLNFADTNSVSFTNTNGSVGVASVKLQMFAVSNTTQSTSGTANHTALSFGGAGAISVGVTGGSVVVSAATQTVQTQSNVQGIIVSNTTYRTGDVSFSNLNGISFGSNGANVVTASYTVPTVTNSSWTVSDAATSGTVARLAFTNLNGVTLSLSTGAAGSHTIVGSHNALTSQSNQAFSAAGGSSAFQTLSFADTNSVSFTNTNGSIGVASVKLQMFAVSNTTQNTSGTANHTALSFGGAGIASVGVTGGSVVISVPSGGGAGDGGVFAGVSTDGNTAGSTGTISTGNFVLVGSNNITLSQSTAAAGSNATVTILGPTLFSGGVSNLGNTGGSTGLVSNQLVFVGSNGITLSQSTGGVSSGTLTIMGWNHISSYENIPPIVSTVVAVGGQSISFAAAFLLPNALSASFLRLPVLNQQISTTIATLASNTATASMQRATSWNAVVYSLGTGASSKSLMSVQSGSLSELLSLFISITSSTRYSISQGVTKGMEGGTTNLTTQYSISNTNYSFTTDQLGTLFSGSRFLDIPFANSLSPGPYWLILGMSTSSASAGAGMGNWTLFNIGHLQNVVVSQLNQNFGIMGSTNLTSGGLLGAGSFSTVGGGTTSALPISAISSSASNNRMYFQLLRSA
jgi:hypothetical protein